MDNFILKQTAFFSVLKLKELLRTNKVTIILMMLILIYISSLYGIDIYLIFKTGSSFLNAQPTSINPIPLNLTGLTFRDILMNGIIVIYLSFLIIIGLRSVVGVSNPFISNQYDANFQQLIPINPFVSFFSNKINSFFRNAILIFIVVFFGFGPLILALQVSLIRLIPIWITYLFGIELISLIGNLLFFLFKPIRSGRDWGVIFAEKNSLIVNSCSMIIPFIFIELAMDNKLMTYQFAQQFAYLPFINIATSNTGFLFRSGIPISTYIGLLSLILQVGILLIIIVLFIKFVSVTSEFGELLPIMEFLNSQQQVLTTNEINFTNTSVSKVKNNHEFLNDEPKTTLLEKDLLLFKRDNDIKFNILIIGFSSLIVIILLLFGFKQNSNLGIYIIFPLMYILLFEIETLLKIFYSLTLNSKLLNRTNTETLQFKIFYSIILFIPFFIMFLIELNFLILVFCIIVYLIIELLNKFKVRSMFINMIIAMFLIAVLGGILIY